MTAIPRRRFLGYVIAAPTLVAGAQIGLGRALSGAKAVVPSLPSVSDLYDLSDLLTDAANFTAHLITVTVNPDGTASFALPRAEVGQGITTAVAMTIADELDLPIEKVRVTLADARPELVWNQITGGSNSMHAIFTPLRVACAIARQQLMEAASIVLEANVARLTAYQGMITAPSGRSVRYADVAVAAAARTTQEREVTLKAAADFAVVGQSRTRIDAHAIVTGAKQFAMDIAVPDALPTMVCRPPTINGTVVSVNNGDAVKRLAGVTHLAVIPTGVAVRARTFGECIAAVRALDVTWGPGTADGKSDMTIINELEQAQVPLSSPVSPHLGTVLDETFVFAFASNTPLETNCAIADVRPDRAEIWGCMKTPIVAQEDIALQLGMRPDQVVVHVTEGGGSFGRHLFYDAPLEAALASKAMGVPVKLMWHRTDDFRQGRLHPMSMSHVRVTVSGSDVVSYVQRHTSVSTDFTHGFGELVSAALAKPDLANLGYSELVYNLTQNVPYDFGAAQHNFNEVDYGFNTGSMRNIYSPNVTTARELMVDAVGTRLGLDPVAVRRQFLRDDRLRAVLEAAVEKGQWGRPLPAGMAQGIALHSEYKSRAAVLVEIDTRPATVNRRVEHAYTGPRVTKAVVAVDAGLPINPKGLEAQMMGALMDGIGLALTFSVHLRDGALLEGSWDDSFYTRQWNVPFELDIVVLPPTTGVPGGVGELGVAPSMAAVACAYARATGTRPRMFPINHNREDLGFHVFPPSPPIPVEPTDGLSRAF